jgi:hypothetical protein
MVPASPRPSGPKKESWKKLESCHSVARRRGDGAPAAGVTGRAACGPREAAVVWGTSS